jgi:glutamyl-tRNA synthetase
MVANSRIQGAWKDIVQGEVKGTTAGMPSIVIIRKDGRPGRALADTVDDHDLKISHSIREEEAIQNSRLQIMISKLLEIDPPEFAHVPHLVNDKG